MNNARKKVTAKAAHYRQEIDASTMDAKPPSIAALSALTGKGDIPQLKTAMKTGLDAGLTYL